MANDDSVTVSFRLNLNREEDKEIHRFLSGEVMKFCFGDKSKFIKSTLIRAIQGVKREENENQFVCEMNTQRAVLQTSMSEEADRIIDAVKLIVKEEAESLVGVQIEKEKQTVSERSEAIPEEIKEPKPCFGEVPESSSEDVSEDVMDFLENL